MSDRYSGVNEKQPLLPDERGHFGIYGGKFVSETLMAALDDLENEYSRLKVDENFLATLNSDLEHYVDVHRRALEQASGRELDPAMCFRAFELSAYDLLVNRFALYMMAHTFRQYPFMEHVTARTRHLIERIRKG